MFEMRYSENATPCAACVKKGVKKTICIEIEGTFICGCGEMMKPEEHALVRELVTKK